jgi:type I restriction enzyme S subunit
VSLADSDKLDRVTISDTEFNISEDGIAHSSAVKHPAGAVVVSRDAGVGKSAVTTEEMAVSQHFIAWVCGRELHNFYLYYWLQRMKPELERIAVGSTIKTIGLPFFRALRIPVPPKPEQRKIADILLSWDEAIGKLEGLVATEAERKRGLMQQLLTGRKRFEEFVKSSRQVRTRYGRFPVDWAAVHIGDIADETSDKNDGGDGLPVLSCTKHRGLVNSLEYFGKRVFSANTNNYKVVLRGDFAYATNHVEEGSIGYQNLHDKALISPMYTVFRTRAGVEHSFFFKLVKTELYRHIFEVNTSGSIARRGGLRWDEFALIKVFLPGVPEQRRIAAVLEVCDREIELLERQLAALKEQKRGLMQKLLTGEVRVKAV